MQNLAQFYLDTHLLFLKIAIADTRPGTIWVFMYPGRVCNFRAGTRVPPSPRLAQKSKTCGKNKMETKFVKTLSYLKARFFFPEICLL